MKLILHMHKANTGLYDFRITDINDSVINEQSGFITRHKANLAASSVFTQHRINLAVKQSENQPLKDF